MGEGGVWHKALVVGSVSLWGGGGGGRVWDLKVCVPKKVRQDFPYCKFRFFSLWSLWSGGAVYGGRGLLLLWCTAILIHTWAT